jgi:hypothetical protein
VEGGLGRARSGKRGNGNAGGGAKQGKTTHRYLLI